ncbi:MAG TPA: sugar phosphate isomerase/epimerase family protein [Bryobacteraceae bacterium]|nr:sugar phosphate isomerase/epimerase family protein [Bryobacteraceae bacterium]
MKALNRRDALKLLAVVPGARALVGQSAARHMFLSLNSVLLSGRVGWPDFAELASQVGYPGCDVMLDPAMKAGSDATRSLFERLHLRPAIVDFPGDFRKDDAAFQASLPKVEHASSFAAAIGCPRMMTYIMPSSDTPKDELRRVYKQRFTESARLLAKDGVRLGLEFLGPLHLRKQFKYEFIWRMNDMLEFAKECGPNIGLTLDSWHWHHAGATIEDIVAAGRERIVHVHFNDAPNLPPEQIRDDERLLPGEGVINLTGFLEALQTIGYTDALSVEVFGRGLKDMTPEAAARLGLESALKVFRKAGVPQG